MKFFYWLIGLADVVIAAANVHLHQWAIAYLAVVTAGCATFAAYCLSRRGVQ